MSEIKFKKLSPVINYLKDIKFNINIFYKNENIINLTEKSDYNKIINDLFLEPKYNKKIYFYLYIENENILINLCNMYKLLYNPINNTIHFDIIIKNNDIYYLFDNNYKNKYKFEEYCAYIYNENTNKFFWDTIYNIYNKYNIIIDDNNYNREYIANIFTKLHLKKNIEYITYNYELLYINDNKIYFNKTNNCLYLKYNDNIFNFFNKYNISNKDGGFSKIYYVKLNNIVKPYYKKQYPNINLDDIFILKKILVKNKKNKKNITNFNSTYTNNILNEIKILNHINTNIKIDNVPKNYGCIIQYKKNCNNNNMYFLLENVGYITLHKYFKNKKNNNDIDISLFKELYKTIKILNKNNIYHKDIKPSNIVYNELYNKLYLIDFGLACSNINNHNCNSNSGTLTFLPPNHKQILKDNNYSYDILDSFDKYAFAMTLTEYILNNIINKEEKQNNIFLNYKNNPTQFYILFNISYETFNDQNKKFIIKIINFLKDLNPELFNIIYNIKK